MKPTLKAKMLKLLGLPEDADEDAFDAAANQYCDTELARRERKEEAPSAPAANEAAQDAALAAMRQQIESAVAAANEQAAALLRAARVDLALDALVASGRVPAADVPAQRARLLAAANDAALAAELEILRAAKPRLQTAAQHAPSLAGQRPATLAANEAAARTRQRDEAVAAVRAERPGLSATVAWGIAASRNPDLFSY